MFKNNSDGYHLGLKSFLQDLMTFGDERQQMKKSSYDIYLFHVKRVGEAQFNSFEIDIV